MDNLTTRGTQDIQAMIDFADYRAAKRAAEAAAETARMEASNQFYNELRISIADRYAADSAAYRAARRINPTVG